MSITVKELMKILKQADPNAEIIIAMNGQCCDLITAEIDEQGRVWLTDEIN